MSAIGVAMWPHLFMKAFAAKDDRTIRRTVILFPTFQLFLIPVFLIGFAGVLFPDTPPEPDFILPFLILRSDLPALAVGLFCAGALSASMSTGDALLHAGASVAVEDGLRPFVKLSDRQQRLLMRILVVTMGAVAYFFALQEGQSLVVLLLTSYGIIVQFTPPVVAALYWRRATTPGVLAGLLAGSLVTLFFFFNPELRPLDLHEGILGLLVHVPVLVGVSLATGPRGEDERTEAFLAAAAGRKPSGGCTGEEDGDHGEPPVLRAELARLRERVLEVDTRLVALIRERHELVLKIGRLKAAEGLPVLDPAREAAVVRRAAALAREAGVDEELVRDVIWRVMASAREEQGRSGPRSHEGGGAGSAGPAPSE